MVLTPCGLPLLCLHGYFNLSPRKLQGRFREKFVKTDLPAFLSTLIGPVVFEAFDMRAEETNALRPQTGSLFNLCSFSLAK